MNDVTFHWLKKSQSEKKRNDRCYITLVKEKSIEKKREIYGVTLHWPPARHEFRGWCRPVQSRV